MPAFLYLFVAIFVYHAAAVSTVPKIVGGATAEEGQFPHQASLRYNNKHFCGGSVIDKRWILTAAHCVSGMSAPAVSVVLGTNTLNKGGDSYQVKELLPHPHYNSKTIENDIALIKLDKDIEFGDKVKTINLPTENFKRVDDYVTLSGWGRTSYPGTIPNKLQFIKLKVIEQDKCASMVSITKLPLSDNNICTLNHLGEGACHGDSGGPLIDDNEQVGVVSWGIPCARNRPDVFTRVYSYLDWINEHVKKDND